MTILYILASISLVSIVSLIGIFTFFIRQTKLDKALFVLVSFAIGSLLGAVFLDILPEVVEAKGAANFTYILAGILLFFVMEKFLFWYHCHKGQCDIHTFRYTNLIGDAIHNFIDGMVIATAFITSVHLGIITTFAIVLHEIPQELGDFGILVYGGFSRTKALFYNFLSALGAFIGAFCVFIFSEKLGGIEYNLLLFAAGGFIYIACSDLMPELGKEASFKRSVSQFAFIFLGIGIIWLMTTLF